MPTKPSRIIAIFFVAAFCLGAAYLAGYARGHTAAMRDDTKFSLVNYLSLYNFQQQGDTNHLADRLRFMIYGYSDYYDRYFSNEAVASASFLKHLADARVIAGQERTQVVSVDSVLQRIDDTLRTNRTK